MGRAVILARITRVRDSVRYRTSEWLLAAAMLAWGISLAMPFNTFHELPSLAPLGWFATEEHWAWACGLLGAVRLLVLVINGAWSLQGHARAILAAFSCFVWTQISFGLFKSGLVNPGQIVYALFVVCDLYAIFRAAGDAAVRDAERKNGRR